ncbi:MAG: SIMPL domain-containing protein [Candidatus Saccharibacteria bacterium]
MPITRKLIQNALIIILTLIMVFGLFISAVADGPAETKPATLVVTGTGYVDVFPEQSHLIITVITTGKTLNSAQSQNSATVSGILKQLEYFGIKRNLVQTTGIYAWPQYNPATKETRPENIAAYQTRDELTVQVNDIKSLGSIINTLLKKWPNVIQSINYTKKDDAASQTMALNKACINARSKANSISRSLGLRLGSIISVNEGPVQIDPSPISRSDGTAVDTAAPQSSGTLRVQSTVKITYQIKR